MEKYVAFTIDNKDCLAKDNQFVLEAAAQNGIYIPNLCNYSGIRPQGSCRICTVRINGKLMTACTTRISAAMIIENNTAELSELRRTIIDLLFVEGNHFCPACEKSGNCELQSLAYHFGITVPQFKYQFPHKTIRSYPPKLLKDHNRCVLCKRCIRGIKDPQGKNIFAFKKRAQTLEIGIDETLAAAITDELARAAMAICPVGAIIYRGIGYEVPIGKRKYDTHPIAWQTEKDGIYK